MERLQKAMERARAQRQLQTEANAATPPARGEGASRFGQDQDAGLCISYTRTATIKAEAVLLRDERVLLAEGIGPISDTYSDAYKVLRTQVLQRMRAKGLRTLAVTSPGPGDGKTTTAINLAIGLARDVNQTVLLVDLDLKRPTVAKYFAHEQSLGISDYLIEGAELADIMFNPRIERLVVLPGNKQITHSSEILSSPRFIVLMDELKSRYEDRVILFDLPPLFASDDVIAFLPYVDAAVLVVEHGKVTKDELVQAQQLLGDKSLGVVVNKTEGAGATLGYY